MRKSSKISNTKDKEKEIKIHNDPDFVCAPGYDNSLARVRSAHPEGVPDSDIVKYLGLKDKAELVALHAKICDKIREYLRS